MPENRPEPHLVPHVVALRAVASAFKASVENQKITVSLVLLASILRLGEARGGAVRPHVDGSKREVPIHFPTLRVPKKQIVAPATARACGEHEVPRKIYAQCRIGCWISPEAAQVCS